MYTVTHAYTRIVLTVPGTRLKGVCGEYRRHSSHSFLNMRWNVTVVTWSWVKYRTSSNEKIELSRFWNKSVGAGARNVLRAKRTTWETGVSFSWLYCTCSWLLRSVLNSVSLLVRPSRRLLRILICSRQTDGEIYTRTAYFYKRQLCEKWILHIAQTVFVVHWPKVSSDRSLWDKTYTGQRFCARTV
jgi:hypothetical protein